MLTCGNIHGPRKAYKDMLDNEVSPITRVSMNHQNQLEQMANVAMFATQHTYTKPLNTHACLEKLEN
jgi:hypothetical protein